ncbi:MAG: OmpH family outer membrane protein [Candidatus Lightella neohaematopini]|nr:OmpH family outer membrane protein [Candidatus Lightella neohaematopini]MCV2531054.1 OmpH family outer membrane protein [Candidatus Lightella neohaematopini]
MFNKLFNVIIVITILIPLRILACNKIAIVNINNIFQQYPKRIEIAKKLESEFENEANELQLMEHEIQNKIQYLQRYGSKMKINERNELENLLIKQRENFSNKAQEFEQHNRRRQTEERDKILIVIQNTVKNIAVKYGYDIVLDSGNVIYSNKIKDITNEVLQLIR